MEKDGPREKPAGCTERGIHKSIGRCGTAWHLETW
jgi:hypothetical protein